MGHHQIVGVAQRYGDDGGPGLTAEVEDLHRHGEGAAQHREQELHEQQQRRTRR